MKDIDGAALTYAEVKAIASGNPLVIEKARIEAEVARLSLLHCEHQALGGGVAAPAPPERVVRCAGPSSAGRGRLRRLARSSVAARKLLELTGLCSGARGGRCANHPAAGRARAPAGPATLGQRPAVTRPAPRATCL